MRMFVRRRAAQVGVVAAALCLNACATMISGSTQKIDVQSTPSGVTVTASPGSYRTTTPGKLALPRKGGPYRLRFEKQGYQPVVVDLKQGTNGWVWGNLLIGGLIGVMVDSSSGASTKLTPNEIDVNLKTLNLSRADFPQGDLLVFDENGALLASVVLED